MEIHHIGYLTKDIQSGADAFLKLGFLKETEIVYDSDRKIKILFMVNVSGEGSYRIELIEPVGTESPFYSLLKKYKNTAYHICYMVEDIYEEIKKLQGLGYIVLQQPMAAMAIENRKVVFLLHPNVGMIELVESEKENEGT